MSKASRRPARQAAQALRKARRAKLRELRETQGAAGQRPTPRAEPSSRVSAYQSVGEEAAERFDALTSHAGLIRAKLPGLLKHFARIPDPRQPKKIKHKLTSVLLYGLLVFVLHYASRRAANTEMTRPVFEENLLKLFPELESLPHADTLFRLLRDIDVAQIEQAHIDMVNQLLRKKKLARWRINNCYPIAIDGTQKNSRASLWSESLQERRRSAADAEGEERYQYHVYVLEANLCFHNGMVIPLMSEFLDYEKGDTEHAKQDCELNAFHRLAVRIKAAFPRLPIMLLLDGLYPNGPLMARCTHYGWDFMIVLKDDSLPTVWSEYQALASLLPNQIHERCWGDRAQHFRWVNGIRYEYGNNGRRHHLLNLVVCEEQWQNVDEQSRLITKKSRHAWLSARPLNPANVHSRCNLGARHRWGIESSILVEKHQGYSYEHLFAYDWTALRGYHYLMRMAHALNTLTRFSAALAKSHAALGIRAFIAFVRNTYSGPWLDALAVAERMNRPFQLRLI